MSAPHLDRPICEPVELQPGAQPRVRRIVEGAGVAPNTPFPHYHDVCELVLFGQVRGDLIADGRRYPLDDGCLAYIPSLRQHDFVLEARPRGWTLLQIDAHAATSLARVPGLEMLGQAWCARPQGELALRIAMLGDWLVEAGEADAIAGPLATLLLHAAVRAPRIAGRSGEGDADALERLRPAIEALRSDPANAPSAEQAAILCALSPAYFSRRFHQQLGMAWSEYVRTHRLHLASQQLLDSDRSAATIAQDLGFATASHFGELFQRCFGLSPSAYRRAGRS